LPSDLDRVPLTDLLFGELAPVPVTAPAPASDPAIAEAAYRVLARKYRPQSFSQLIGQDVLVRTLTNAFASNRIAHAFMLTGIRGTGKTTTARIIARGLNCIGADGAGGPTIEPCGVCTNCIAIAADRHVDVIEMDAASHNSVEDIRELTDGARYAPALGRYKVYIVDEVHMLSKAAFNALLKTLEEPPAHVKFVLATTEIRKVPVTILSRCQRFDLRRIDVAVLTRHFRSILAQEGATADDEALALLARAADGSARDGMSLLDQAISRANGEPITGEIVRDMLGLADRIVTFDLLEAVLKGEAATALNILETLHQSGADPITVLQDLLELVHHLTRDKLSPRNNDDVTMPEAERVRGAAMSQALGMPVLSRAWSVLLKGIGEAQGAPSARQALEMVILRLIYTADLPPPGELVKQLRDGGAATVTAPPARTGGSAGGGAAAMARPIPAVAESPEAAAKHPAPTSFADVVALFTAEREAIVAGQLFAGVHLVHFEPGRIEFRPEPSVQPQLASIVARKLTEWTGTRWMVSIASAEGAPTLSQAEAAARSRSMDEATGLPSVAAVLEAFPGARLVEVRTRTAAPVVADTLPVQADTPPDDEFWLEE
jgi:DNA polymerase-3 subunit gamma/tau